jgi:post-segregation antitoxin (ccd killing protein)
MIKYKKRLNFSIDIKVSDDFKKVCNDKSINMSKLIENYMKEFIDKNNKNI